jgi:hypothetical protein
MGLIKNILIVMGVGVVLLAMRMYQVKSGSRGEGDVALNAFVETPRPSNAPATKVLLFGPENCPKEAGRRIDNLARAIHAAGIPCVRLTTASFSSSDASDGKRINRVMSGELPIVFVGNYAKNNPTLEEIKNQMRAGQKQ